MAVIKKRVALIYDFDGTLAKGNMQEHSFIPEVLKMDKKDFWCTVKMIAKKENVDEILVYMHQMIKEAKRNKICVTPRDLEDHGKQTNLFSGLEDGSWFERINTHGREHDLIVEHYVISSGVEEMIRGCPIWERFRCVFASKFIWEDGVARWPGVAINYTTKTQYLFRINKGIENHYDNDKLNAYMSQGERPIPFSRMIFVGDGVTDIPAMKMMTHQGGCAIAAYDPACNVEDLKKIHGLIADRRVDFVAPANYESNSQMDVIVKGILSRMRRDIDE